VTKRKKYQDKNWNLSKTYVGEIGTIGEGKWGEQFNGHSSICHSYFPLYFNFHVVVMCLI